MAARPKRVQSKEKITSMTIDQREFRRVLGNFATGVTIITAAHEGTLTGFTANAIASISLDPPLVMVSIGTQNATLGIINASQTFCINILHAEQEALARCFATNGPSKYEHFCDAPSHHEVTGAPVLDDALGWIDCRLYGSHPAGDHIILLGEVVGLGAVAGNPLLFLRGQYTHLPE